MTGYQLLAAFIAFFGVFGGAILIGRIETMHQAQEDGGLECVPRNELERRLFRTLSAGTLLRLDRAGLRSITDRSVFALMRLVFLVVLGVVVGSLALMKGDLPMAVLGTGLGAFFGWWAPGFWSTREMVAAGNLVW